MTCAHCGLPLEPLARFCSHCGTPAPAAHPPDSALSEEAAVSTATIQMERPQFHVPRWRLACIEGKDVPDGFPLLARSLIGRDPKCEIQLLSLKVSRVHAVIEYTGDGFRITDLNSTNGTYLNRSLIKEPTPLKIGQTLQFGEYKFMVMRDAIECRNCREVVRNSDKFCQHCGARLLDDDVRQPSPRPLPATSPIPAQPGTGPVDKLPDPNLRPGTGPADKIPDPSLRPGTGPADKVSDPSLRPGTGPARLDTPRFPMEHPSRPSADSQGQAPSSGTSTPHPAPRTSHVAPRTSHVAPRTSHAAPAPRRSFWKTCLLTLAISACLLVVCGAGTYLLFQNGTFHRRMLLNRNTGEISITNTAGGTLSAVLTALDTESGSPETYHTLTLVALDMSGMGYLPAGRYTLEISGLPVPGSCALRISGGDHYHIIAVPEGFAITAEGYTPQSSADLDMASASLCRQQ